MNKFILAKIIEAALRLLFSVFICVIVYLNSHVIMTELRNILDASSSSPISKIIFCFTVSIVLFVGLSQIIIELPKWVFSIINLKGILHRVLRIGFKDIRKAVKQGYKVKTAKRLSYYNGEKLIRNSNPTVEIVHEIDFKDNQKRYLKQSNTIDLVIIKDTKPAYLISKGTINKTSELLKLSFREVKRYSSSYWTKHRDFSKATKA